MSRVKLTVLVLILALPALTLVPLGTLWLWQQKLLLVWALSAFAFTVVGFSLASTILARLKPPSADGIIAPEGGGSASEIAAWAAVRRFAATIDPATIQSRADLLDIAARTVENVAQQFHPTDKSPVLNFTVPELLLLTERVSRRLRPVFVDNVPLAEQLSVSQMLRIYEWRSMIDIAGNAYEVWRLLRIANPLSAVTHEARERITKQIVSSLRDDVSRRLIDVAVYEIASAAIDLYSGRLQTSKSTLAQNDTLISEPGNEAGTAADSRSLLGRTWREVSKAARGARSLYRNKPLQK